MPRVLVASFAVCPAPDHHGVELVDLLKTLRRRFDVDGLTLRAGDLPHVERFMGTRMLRVPVAGLLAEQVEVFRRALRRQLESEEYDLVHLRSAWGARALFETARSPLRVIYQVARAAQGEPAAGDATVASERTEEEETCLARADLILVPSQAAGRHLARRVDASRLVVLPAGVDVDEFDWEPCETGAPWLSSPGAQARILHLGRVSAGRGIRLLIQAFARMVQKVDARLTFAGPVAPEFHGVLSRAVHDTGAGDRIGFLGALEHADLPRLIAQATVGVLPSAPDESNRPLGACPTKLLEFLACRRSVVAPRVSSVLEIVRDDEEALLFAPGDAADLAEKLGRLLRDGALRQRLAEAGYRHVRSSFPAAAARRVLLEAYARLCPVSRWMPPARSVDPVGVMPVSPEVTTARRPLAEPDDLDEADEDAVTAMRRRTVGEATARTPLGGAALQLDGPIEEGDFVADGVLLGGGSSAAAIPPTDRRT